jgi:hypothetical protein
VHDFAALNWLAVFIDRWIGRVPAGRQAADGGTLAAT